MKSVKKALCLALVTGLSLTPAIEAKVSLSSFSKKSQAVFKEAKANVKNAYADFSESLSKTSKKTQQLWHDLTPDTQAALLGGLAAIGAAAVAGTGYAVSQTSSKPAEGPSFEQIWNKMPEEDQQEVLNILTEVTADSYKS